MRFTKLSEVSAYVSSGKKFDSSATKVGTGQVELNKEYAVEESGLVTVLPASETATNG